MGKFIVLQSFLLAILIYGYREGYAEYVYHADRTHLVVFIFIAFLIGLAFVPKKPDIASWISVKLVDLGLLGTVLGFIIALSGVSIAAVNDPEQVVQMVTQLLSGMRTALFTTITGLVGYLWLSLTIRINRQA